jgi:hypothetical protein
MPDTDLLQTTTTALKSGVADFSLGGAAIDEAGDQSETYWYNSEWKQRLAYYNEIPDIKQAVDSLAKWSFGKGYKTENDILKVDLEKVSGWGEDTFDSIMMNMLIVKKVNGDAFAEIIKKKGHLLNLKPLNPETIRTVVNRKGIIIRYDELTTKGNKVRRSYQPEEIFHISNDRIANEIHGKSIIESTKWAIDAKQEAIRDWRRVLHRTTIRVMYIDADDTTRLNTIKTQYKEAIKNGELMIIPAKRGEAEFEDITTPPIQPFLDWVRYLDNYINRALGVPTIILGGSDQGATEAQSKVGYLVFEVPYTVEQRLMEQDIWNQLSINITFNRPVSLKEETQANESANTGQLGIQPNEVEAQLSRTE